MPERLPNLILEHFLMDTQGLDALEAWTRVLQDYDNIKKEYDLLKSSDNT